MASSRSVTTAPATPFRPLAGGAAGARVRELRLDLERRSASSGCHCSALVARWRGLDTGDDLRAQYAIHRGMRLWVRLAQACGIASVSVRGADALRAGPVVVVANHPSLIDTPILLSVMPQADLIVNASVGRQSRSAPLRRGSELSARRARRGDGAPRDRAAARGPHARRLSRGLAHAGRGAARVRARRRADRAARGLRHRARRDHACTRAR